ncbi:MAG: DUF1343 domain-containing protein [Fibrobacterales bacterium]|nr:DUF1343 domain-containing protein [Fibrobacterales bacterium]
MGSPSAHPSSPRPPRTVLPVERLAELWPEELRGLRLGALLHPASVLPDTSHVLGALKALDGKLFRLSALFGPQHGILGQTQDNMVEWEGGVDESTGLPLFSLYGTHREPTPEMLSGIDVLLVDLQDVGARYYTFVWSLWLCMRACEKAGVAVVVCDRPNPIGNAAEGELLDLEFSSFVGMDAIPNRHGKTIGELAEQFRRERFPKTKLFVLPMENHDPAAWFDETGLPWVFPSPNMPTLDTAVVYPGMCLLEATNLSEGRGTTKPFELFGAPWLDADALCAHVNGLGLPGAVLRAAHFAPTFHKYRDPVVAGWADPAFREFAGAVCHGAQIHVTDRDAFRSLDWAVEILRYAFHRHPDRFAWRPASAGYEYNFKHLAIDLLLGSSAIRRARIEERPL